jgi:hypothetical protein
MNTLDPDEVPFVVEDSFLIVFHHLLHGFHLSIQPFFIDLCLGFHPIFDGILFPL